jgi:hypothetical protein
MERILVEIPNICLGCDCHDTQYSRYNGKIEPTCSYFRGKSPYRNLVKISELEVCPIGERELI